MNRYLYESSQKWHKMSRSPLRKTLPTALPSKSIITTVLPSTGKRVLKKIGETDERILDMMVIKWIANSL